MSKRLALTLSLAASLLQTGAAAQNAWVSIGPEGGTITALAMDPQTPTTLYASIESAGVFKTTDGGSHWRAVNSGLPLDLNSGYPSPQRWFSALAVDPRSPATVYAAWRVFPGESDLFKTTDGGNTWQAASTGLPSKFGITSLAIAPTTPTTIYLGGDGGVMKSSNGAGTWTGTGITAPIAAIAIDARTPSTVFAGGANALFKSRDGGRTWISLNTGFAAEAELTSIAIDPRTPVTIYAALQVLGVTHVYKSVDGGDTWREVYESPLAQRFSTLVIDAQNPSHLYLGTLPGHGVFFHIYTTDGIFKSVDGGANWNAIDRGLGNGSITAVVTDPRTRGTVYVGTEHSGIFKSTNGGQTWQAINAGLPGLSTEHLMIDPRMPSVMYAETEAGFYKTTDGGTWRAINAGMPTLSGGQFRFDPRSPATIYAANEGHGLYKSNDGGTIWRALTNGLTHRFIRALAVDPGNSSTLYAGGENSGDDFGYNTPVFIFKSIDAGGSWRQIKVSDTGAILMTLDIDPQQPTTLYATTWAGIFKSADGGLTWSAINTGLMKGSTAIHTAEAVEVHLFVIDPRSSTTLYAVQGATVLKSLDGGRAWHSVFTVPGNYRVSTLTIDRQTPSMIYVGTSGGGVFITTDAGQTWTVINAGLTDTKITALVIDPRTPGNVYVGTADGKVFRSLTGGSSWSPLHNGLTARTVWTLAIDTRNPMTIYAGTSVGVFALRIP